MSQPHSLIDLTRFMTFKQSVNEFELVTKSRDTFRFLIFKNWLHCFTVFNVWLTQAQQKDNYAYSLLLKCVVL